MKEAIMIELSRVLDCAKSGIMTLINRPIPCCITHTNKLIIHNMTG